MILRAAERFMIGQPGIDTWHCFSSSGHYDPSRLGVGALIAVDEHVVAPGAGFAEHAHRGVDIVSWVAAGTLCHNADLLVAPGEVLLQSTGSGIRHTEGNGSAAPLRLIQMALLSPVDTPSTRLVELPLAIGGGRFDVHRVGTRELVAPAHLLVVRGRFESGTDLLRAGDSATVDADHAVTGKGELLIWELA